MATATALTVYHGRDRLGRAQRLTVEVRRDGRFSYVLVTHGVHTAVRGISSLGQLTSFLTEGRFSLAV